MITYAYKSKKKKKINFQNIRGSIDSCQSCELSFDHTNNKSLVPLVGRLVGT